MKRLALCFAAVVTLISSEATSRISHSTIVNTARVVSEDGRAVCLSQGESLTVMAAEIEDALRKGQQARFAIAITNHTKESILVSPEAIEIMDGANNLGLLGFRELMEKYKSEPMVAQQAIAVLQQLKMLSMFNITSDDVFAAMNASKQNQPREDAPPPPDFDVFSGASKLQAANGARIREQSKLLYAWRAYWSKIAHTIPPGGQFVVELHSKLAMTAESNTPLTLSINLAEEKHDFRFDKRTSSE